MSKEYWRRQALEIVCQILNGQLDELDGARRLASHEFRFVLSDSNVPDCNFNLFDVVADDSEELPFGSERQHWNRSVLAEKEKEIARLRTFYKEDILAACHSLLAKLK